MNLPQLTTLRINAFSNRNSNFEFNQHSSLLLKDKLLSISPNENKIQAKTSTREEFNKPITRFAITDTNGGDNYTMITI